MADQDVSPPSNLPPRRAAGRLHPASREVDDTEKAFLNAVAPDSTTAFSSAEDQPRGQPLSSTTHRSDAEKRLSAGAHRAHKPRSSRAFLLANSLLSRSKSAQHHDVQPYTPPDKRQSRQHHAEQRGSKYVHHGPAGSMSRASSSSMPGVASDPGNGPELSGQVEERSTSTTVTKRDSFNGDTAVDSPSSIAQLDMESTQIVTMALNLSESRRLAARRNVSQPTPPRLAPLPDGAPGGSLRYHLQQQRKMSRTVSPKPDRSPRMGSGRAFTPLQPAFEPGATYRYHFSTSTLARVQKAKEYLELMAQYRRALELLAPLEPERTTPRPWTVTPPVTPNGSAPVSRMPSGEPETRIGRPYNPLQYIRNRKVRARERKAIDGAAQGFDDAARVSEWIDEVAKWVATGQARIPGNPALPPFPSTQAADLQGSPPSSNGRTSVVTKPKRPRVDWVIDPADMLADVYWLELDDNKKLVEDRHWRRVFPQKLDVARPLSRDETPRLATPRSAKELSDAHTPGEKATSDPPSSRHQTEHVLSAARDRAQQKLQALKGSHHRHSSLIVNRDLLRLHRGSGSESSDTDSDRRRRARGGAAGSTVRSVLEKQMEEMIAREQKEAEWHPLYDHEAKRMRFASPSPELDAQHASQDPKGPGGADSHAELSEAEARGLGLKPLPWTHSSPPYTTARNSLDVPGSKRVSVDDGISQPTSPALRPSHDGGLIPAIGMDLSPVSSRPSSPHRNPLTRVRSFFRERSRERGTEGHLTGEEAAGMLSSPSDNWIAPPESAESSGASLPQRRASRSPVGDGVMSHRSHKSLSSVRLRGEDGGISLRSLIRGQRIDTVLRSGVSKVSDMFWRKDASDEQSSSTSSDDSEDEVRGRSRGILHGRSLSVQDAKLLSPGGSQLNPDHAKSGSHGQLLHPPSRPISRRSSRFDLLKPPRINVQSASSSQTATPVLVPQQEPPGSDTESLAGRDDVRAPAASLDAVLTVHNPHRHSTTSSSRQWSIPDRGASTGSAVSRREIARLRALLLSSGIHAMELDRRAKQRKLLPSPMLTTATSKPPPSSNWQEIVRLAPDASAQQRLLNTPLTRTDFYPIAARTLASSVEKSAAHFNSLSSKFSAETAPELIARIEALRSKVDGELTALTRSAADAADEANHDLVVGQRLKVKRVVDSMETMLRRRRRRLRWVRRAGWLVVEWLLVGCMWYVWFVVMIARVVLGVGKGFVRGVRWLLWL
ncbi:uncharacterized protein B0T15DRAFT_515644 [Chaetomium strumarium]|uniref:Uncharacterized protein n=1 Tax=Chaetomium strumarium TaxID=1170767 RepID=A0AAJ0H0G5_9PEZI|nr:hypothetical protein B0T15DRAFT_515644 [Chaetomium strumarium]